MTTRTVFQAFALSLAAFAAAPLPVLLAEEAAQEIENSKFQAQGEINANAVYIRAGASENDYPTIKLDRGAQVTVTGIKFDWLKIVPPEGSYCYVAKAYVEKRGDGTVGRVTNGLNVRVGSSLNAMKTKVAAKLDVGDDVKILGEQDEYFKIAPPKSVFLYVNKQFVDLKTVGVADAGKKPETIAPPVTPPAPPEGQAPPVVVTPPVVAPPEITPPIAGDSTASGAGGSFQMDPATPPVTPPAIDPAEPVVIAPPATQPSNDTVAATPPAAKPVDPQAEAEGLFDQLERTFIENDRKPLDQQPLAELQSGYEKLAVSSALPESLRRMAEYRLGIVKQRSTDREAYVAVKKQQEEMIARGKALQAEREELETRIKATGVKYFAAVGTLRVSSLQQGGGILYRLTDPKTGRTVVYIRSEDPKIGTMVGQFIGVSGSVQNEATFNLKTVVPTGFELVDQSKVGISIAAQIVPPSLMPAGTASTGTE